MSNYIGFKTAGDLIVIPGCDSSIGSLNNGTVYTNYISKLDTQLNIENVLFNNGQIIIQSTTPYINSTTSSLIVYGGVSIYNDSNINGILTLTNTTDSIDISSGSLVISGGVAISKNLNINGEVNVYNNHIINVPLPINQLDAVNKEYVDYNIWINNGYLLQIDYTLLNNISIPTNITGFIFDNNTSTFETLAYIEIPSLNIYEQWKIYGLLNNNIWSINSNFISSSPSKIRFFITNIGQIQYINNNSSNATLRYKLITLSH